MNILNVSFDTTFPEEYIPCIFETAAAYASSKLFVLHGDCYRESTLYSLRRWNHSSVYLRPFEDKNGKTQTIYAHMEAVALMEFLMFT